MLFDGGLIERRGLRVELHVDGFALDLVGPFEVRAMVNVYRVGTPVNRTYRACDGPEAGAERDN